MTGRLVRGLTVILDDHSRALAGYTAGRCVRCEATPVLASHLQQLSCDQRRAGKSSTVGDT